MSEETKELNEKATQFFAEKKWDEAIAVLTKVIRLEEDYEEKAEAYLNRGTAYGINKDHDLAIKDFDKALELRPNSANTYNSRGITYANQENYDRAIEDFDKAIALNPKEPSAHRNRGDVYNKKGNYDRAIEDYNQAIAQNEGGVAVYNNRGIAYINQKNYDRAIEDYNQAILLNPRVAKTYHNLGNAYAYKENLDRAIDVWGKAIELNPTEASTYHSRGGAYRKKGKYHFAYNDFLTADKYDKQKKSSDALIYIASRLAGTSLDEETQADIFKNYFYLASSVDAIRTILKLPEGGEVAHYTSLYALKFLADFDTGSDNNSFRLYNTTYMNDPEEGQTFFEIMKGEIGIDVQKMFYGNDSEKPHFSQAYIGSFVKIDPRENETRDKLFLWRTYGKHDNVEAAGACLIFKEEQFAEKVPPLQIGPMFQLMDDLRQRETTKQNLPPVLYEVIYKNEISTKLLKKLKTLAEDLKNIDECCKLHETDKEKFADLTREILDSIRFLFKEDHYREENEARVIEMLYSVDGEQVPQRKVDMDRIPPRFYLEMPGDITFSEVILGPKTDKVPEWKQWLREKNIENVSQSNIKYR